ncbi:dopamine receptor D2 like isoform X4 [Phyllopteryx taeniolatus]|uniref:dopamine receptor D2 like isoform X4 n=1 Tax=Phyllopteryx taeniolatus TaxID=161469 RepID=UPI002AD40851|nr:dopamine receptor D2 like isoform X4 [Phyllopteryx taeniolatus]
MTSHNNSADMSHPPPPPPPPPPPSSLPLSSLHLNSSSTLASVAPSYIFLTLPDNCSGAVSASSSPPYNFYAVLLVLLIFCVVFGNVLVCVAVSRERALQTTTNYLIVSLAVSDLLLATLVMPWGVYLEVVGEWRFSLIHCDILLTLDVMMCTASILNLCAISIDRYTAVAMPLLYNTRYSSRRRVALMIAAVWFLSFAISCPLLFGLNNTDAGEGGAGAPPGGGARSLPATDRTEFSRAARRPNVFGSPGPGDRLAVHLGGARPGPPVHGDALGPNAPPPHAGRRHAGPRELAGARRWMDGRDQGEGQGEDVAAEGEEGHADARHCARCVHHLLAAFLPDARSEGSLRQLLHLAVAVQHRHMAGLPQQRRQPHHLHHLQRGVPQGLHQNPPLLTAHGLRLRPRTPSRENEVIVKG